MGTNNATSLPHRTSILDVKLPIPVVQKMQKENGLNIYPMALALMFSSPTFFRQNSNDVRAALSSISGASELLSPLLEGGHSLIAGRLAGAFRNIGREKIADEILATMKSAGYDSRETDPFEQVTPLSFTRKVRSPYVSRLRLMWETMRQDAVGSFPLAPRKNVTRYLKHVKDVYATDAYHSLSIEGYKVSLELIEKVRQGTWNPESSERDRDHKNALAARGYWQSHQMVLASLTRVLAGENAGVVADADHGAWYRELFAPSVTAGLLRPSDLAGYRSEQVFIRHSKHVPPSRDAVRELMPALFDLIEHEDDAAVRAVLGHFVFVYIHPYMDGNGRIGRFLMNVMFASGGYPWTVVPLARRGDYLAALESASVRQDILPLTKLLSTLVEETIAGTPQASRDATVCAKMP